MSTLEICLLVVGIVLMIASFFITEKLSSNELNKLSELSTEEMQKILERNLNDAQKKVDNMVDQVIDHSIEKSMDVVERALDKETNEKMRVLTEYSDTVLESINKTHNEVMFLYSMLNDKHSELTKYAGNLAQLAIHLEELEQNIEKTIAESPESPGGPSDTAASFCTRGRRSRGGAFGTAGNTAPTAGCGKVKP